MFQGAPFTKFVSLLIVICYLIFEAGGINGSDLMSLDFEDVIHQGQIHRLFTYPLTFHDFSELLMGMTVLCPLLRRFEREMGTKKFVTFLFVKTTILTTIFLFITWEVFEFDFAYASGPYPHIGVVLYLFYNFTPRLHPNFFGVLGFDFSEKSVTYGIAIQVILSSGWKSLLPTVFGYLSGYLCSSDRFGLAKWSVLPDNLYYIGMNIGHSIGFSDSTPQTLILPGRQQPRRQRPGDGRQTLVPDGRLRPVGSGTGNQQANSVPTPIQPSPEAIEQLTNMGFDRAAVERALRASDNNIEAAANILLSGS